MKLEDVICKWTIILNEKNSDNMAYHRATIGAILTDLASSAAPVNHLVGRISFIYGNHTCWEFTNKLEALQYISDLSSEEGRPRLQNIEMFMLKQRGYEPTIIHRGTRTLSNFIRKVEDAIDSLPCPGCDYQTCDCGFYMEPCQPNNQSAASRNLRNRTGCQLT